MLEGNLRLRAVGYFELASLAYLLLRQISSHQRCNFACQLLSMQKRKFTSRIFRRPLSSANFQIRRDLRHENL